MDAPSMPEPQVAHTPGNFGTAAADQASKLDETVKANAETLDRTADWAVVSDAMMEYDERIIGDWKDDLGNLLVFAGLFSSVLTGFVIESYGWLQPDTSPAMSVQLLTQISAQLASFSVSPGFVNSTSLPASLQQLSPSSNLPPSSIRINILWFLSLGLSLTASLFAIMAQQWLREYRVPGHLTIRERVRLRQLRYEALNTWSVPSIIALLPVMLQIALIMFLAGLCYLLFTLERTVAIVFVIFVGVAVSAYFSFTILPIFFRRCPYRNPLSHAFLSFLESLAVVLYAVYLLILLVVLFLTQLTLEWLKGLRGQDGGPLIAKIERKIDNIMVAAEVLPSLDVHSLGHELWSGKDIAQISREADALSLDQEALAWAPSAVSKAKVTSLDCCLEDLPPNHRLECVASWTAETLHISRDGLDASHTTEAGTGHLFNSPVIYNKLDAQFSARYKEVLLKVLPTRFPMDSKPMYGYSVLNILQRLSRNGAWADADFRHRFIRRLLDIFSAQTPEDLAHNWSRLPALCVFDLVRQHQYLFAENDIHILFDQAIRAHGVFKSRASRPAEFVLLSHVVPFSAVSLQPSLLQHDTVLRSKCHDLLVKLHQYIPDNRGLIRANIQLGADFWQDGVFRESADHIIELCKSFVTLADAGALPLPLSAEHTDAAAGTESDQPTMLAFLARIIDLLHDLEGVEEGLACVRQCYDRQVARNQTTSSPNPGSSDTVVGQVLQPTSGIASGEAASNGVPDEMTQNKPGGHVAVGDINTNTEVMSMPEAVHMPEASGS